MTTDTKLSSTETSIAEHAIALLQQWDWEKGEPLAALSVACKELYGAEHHDSLVNIRKIERLYAPAGAISNNTEARLASLRSVIRFHR